jgi:hypothetical protein
MGRLRSSARPPDWCIAKQRGLDKLTPIAIDAEICDGNRDL